MRRILSFVSSLAFTTLAFGSLQFAAAQAPSSVQVFLPNGGGPPSRSLRLTLVRDDGYVDVVFTDSNGKFKIRTPRTGTAAYYTVTVETDNQTFATTTTTFKVEPNNPNETIIFLRPLTTDKRAVIDVIDATNFEGSVPAKARAAYKHGMDFLNEGKMESAITSLQEAINLYPQYVRAMNDLGVIFLKLNRLEEAGDWFRRATEISKRFFHPRMNLGIVLNRQGKFREALEVLEPLYHENPRMLEIRLAYGRALEGAGELGTAEKLYRSTLTSKSLAPAVRANMEFRLGVLLNRQGRYADAVQELEQAIMLDHDVANFHLQLGGALMQMQRYAEAERHLLRAYELGGSDAGGAQLLLGHLYFAQRRLDDAQKAFEQFLKDLPSAPNAAQISKLIADLKAAPRN